MNKFIKKQLDKVTNVTLEYDENTTNIFIPRVTSIKLEEDEYYLIELNKSVLEDEILASNWNKGKIPKYTKYNICVNSRLSDMIKVTAIPVEGVEKFEGWLPIKKINVLEKL